MNRNSWRLESLNLDNKDLYTILPIEIDISLIKGMTGGCHAVGEGRRAWPETQPVPGTKRTSRPFDGIALSNPSQHVDFGLSAK